MKRLWLAPLPILTLAVSWTLVAGCATEATPEDEPDSALPPEVDSSTADANKVDAKPPTPDANVRDTSTPDANKPDSTTTPDSSVTDATADVDSGIGNLPGEAFDPTAPKTGAACPAGVAEFDVITRRCGACGSQKAFCEAGRIVGAYGACIGEKTGADICLPGAREVGVECGLCGSQVRNCDGTCVWSSALCTGEVVGGCPKGQITYVEGVCTDPTQVRKQTCSQTCTRQAPEACAARPVDEIVASQTAGTVVSADVEFWGKNQRLNTGTCPQTLTTSSSSLTSYAYARIKNNGADSINVSVANAILTGGTTRPDTVITSYPGPNVPADRTQCTGSVSDTSPETVVANIPAGGSIIVLQNLYSTSSSGAKTRLDVTTNFIGAPPTFLTVPATVGSSATFPVVLGAAKIVRPNVPSPDPGPCPLSLSSTSTSYQYVEVRNTTAAPRTVTLETTALDTMLAYYTGATPPATTAERLACVGEFADGSSTSTLTNVVIPANSSITAYIGGYSSSTTGNTGLKVTTTN